MDEICVVPEEVLNTISTKALLITCLNYPRLIDLFLASDLQTGFNFYSSHFNGLANLLKRPDLSKVLLTTYSEFDYSSNQIKGYDQKFTSKQIAFFECILAQKEIIKTFEKNNRLQLLSQAIKNLEQRKRHKESFYRQRTTALILSRILFSENLGLSRVDPYGNDIFEIFNTNVVVLDTSIFDQLLLASKELIKKIQ